MKDRTVFRESSSLAFLMQLSAKKPLEVSFREECQESILGTNILDDRDVLSFVGRCHSSLLSISHLLFLLQIGARAIKVMNERKVMTREKRECTNQRDSVVLLEDEQALISSLLQKVLLF